MATAIATPMGTPCCAFSTATTIPENVRVAATEMS